MTRKLSKDEKAFRLLMRIPGELWKLPNLRRRTMENPPEDFPEYFSWDVIEAIARNHDLLSGVQESLPVQAHSRGPRPKNYNATWTLENIPALLYNVIRHRKRIERRTGNTADGGFKISNDDARAIMQLLANLEKTVTVLLIQNGKYQLDREKLLRQVRIERGGMI